jgi:hypothetical protein
MMTVDETLAVVHRNECRELHVVGSYVSRVLAAEVERLRDENHRLVDLLSDALAHCPDSYRRPILNVLRRTIDEAAVDAEAAEGNRE